MSVIKSAAGEVNFLKLVPEALPPSEGSPPVAGASAPAKPAAPDAPLELPSLVLKSRLGVELLNARLSYVDQSSGLTQTVQDLDLALRDISLTRPIGLEATARLSTKMGATFQLDGPVRLAGTLTPTFQGVEFVRVAAELKGDFSDLRLASGDLFLKKPGVPVGFDAKIAATPQRVDLQRVAVKFHNAEVLLSGSAERPGTGEPALRLEIGSNPVALAAWAELVPMLAPYALEGSVRVNAAVEGPASALKYRATIEARELAFKAPMVRQKPKVQAKIEIITDEVKSLVVSLRGPGAQASLTGSLKGFLRPEVALNLQSQGFDLDQFLELPPLNTGDVGKKAGAGVAPGVSGQPAASAAATGSRIPGPASDYDALVEPLRQVAYLRGVRTRTELSVEYVQAYGVQIRGINSTLRTEGLKVLLERFGFSLFEGQIRTEASMDLAPAQPTYGFKAGVQGFNVRRAVESQLQLFKNTVYGKVNLEAEGGGASFNPIRAIPNLGMKGNLRAEDAVFATIDVSRMVGDGLNEGLAKAADKVPALRGKKINATLKEESRYEWIASSFSMKNGAFAAPDFKTKAAKNRGIDLSGDTRVNLVTGKLSAKWKAIDTYGLTQACELDVELGPATIRHVICKGKDPFQLPLTVGGTLAAPEYSYSEVPGYLAGVAAANAAGAGKSVVQKKVTQAVTKQVKKAAGEKAGKGAKKLLDQFKKKKLF
ncbi:MAG: hypothetical protein IT285_11730 [Bdellovibrionales bacterium]|nr:hypothetical protein [Bdellovibrionales bacterium]